MLALAAKYRWILFLGVAAPSKVRSGGRIAAAACGVVAVSRAYHRVTVG